MKASLAMVTFLSLCIMISATAYGAQDVGGDFGISWLKQHGTQFSSSAETQNSLWNWGSAPKGYTFSDGNVIPPGYGTQWYYPSSQINSTPITVNSTNAVGSSYLVPNFQSSISEGDWLQAQLTGRPIAVVSASNGPLF